MDYDPTWPPQPFGTVTEYEGQPARPPTAEEAARYAARGLDIDYVTDYVSADGEKGSTRITLRYDDDPEGR